MELLKMKRISERLKVLLNYYTMKELVKMTCIEKSKLYDYLQHNELASEIDASIIAAEVEKLDRKLGANKYE